MKKHHLISLVAAGSLAAGSAWLGAQTEVTPPVEEVTPAPAPATEDVDDKTKATAEDALKNFKTGDTTPAPAAATPAPAPTPAAEVDPIIPSAPIPTPSSAQVEAAKEKAREAGVSEENIQKAGEAAGEAVEAIGNASANEVEAAMEALEELGQQAKRALEEADVVADGTGTPSEGTAREVATEPGSENSLMPDNLSLDALPSDAAERANQLVQEMGVDPAELAKADAKRQEFVSKIMAESDAKKAKLTFRRAFTAATNSPDAIALKAAAEAAKTDEEKRELLRQYYAMVFKDVNKRAPGIKEYSADREKEYIRVIDKQVPPTEAISLAPIEPAAAKPSTDT